MPLKTKLKPCLKTSAVPKPLSKLSTSQREPGLLPGLLRSSSKKRRWQIIVHQAIAKKIKQRRTYNCTHHPLTRRDCLRRARTVRAHPDFEEAAYQFCCQRHDPLPAHCSPPRPLDGEATSSCPLGPRDCIPLNLTRLRPPLARIPCVRALHDTIYVIFASDPKPLLNVKTNTSPPPPTSAAASAP